MSTKKTDEAWFVKALREERIRQAAPDLLEVVEKALAPCERCSGNGAVLERQCVSCGGTGLTSTLALSWGDVRAAIAKARGES